MTSRPTPVKRYHDYLLQTVNDLNVFNKWFVSPLNLGGVAGEAGGSGVPLAGIVGQLIQSRVAYDTTEAVTLTVPPSGQSLVHNLNRIRYWLNQKSNALVIQDEGVEVASGVTILDFVGAPVEASLSGGKVLVTISGTGGGGSDTVKVSSDDTVANYLENKLTAGSSKITVTTANPGGNEERQVDLGAVNINDLNDVVITTPIDNHVLSYDSGGFINQTLAGAGIAPVLHTHLEEDVTDLEHDAIKLQGTPVSDLSPENHEILAYSLGGEWVPSGLGVSVDNYTAKVSTDDTTPDFLENKIVAGTNVTVTVLDPGGDETLSIASTASGGGASLTVQEDDSPIVTDVTVLNFEGGAEVTDEGSGKATITISGGGGGGGPADFTLWMPEAPPASPSSYDDEFEDSSVAGKWTEFDVSSSITVNEAEYGLYFTGGTANDVQGIWQQVPDQDFAIFTYVNFTNRSDGDHTAGLLLLSDTSDLANSDVYTYGLYRGSSFGLRSQYFTDYNSISATRMDRTGGPGSWDPGYWLRFRQTTNAWNLGYSVNGLHWFDLDNGHTEDFTVDGVGLFQRINTVSDANNKVIFSFFRYSTNADLVDVMYGDRVNMWRA